MGRNKVALGRNKANITIPDMEQRIPQNVPWLNSKIEIIFHIMQDIEKTFIFNFKVQIQKSFSKIGQLRKVRFGTFFQVF